VAVVVTAQPDEEAQDGAILEPAAVENKETDFSKDIKGIQQLESSQQQQMMELIMEYKEQFGDAPSLADLPAHHIDTGQAKPVCRKPYRTAIHFKQKLEEHIKQLLDDGIIRPSTSPWSSPALTVPKKSGGVRLCVDFREVNKLILRDSYPLPLIDDLLKTVSSATYLTTLDLTQGYHQVGLDKDSIPKTAFTVHNGKYEYTRMPFGLSNAPPHFQRAMDETFSHLGVSAYLDDIVIPSNSWQEHLQLLRKVLDICK